MRKVAITIICCIFISCFTACYDAREISSYAYVITVGVDYGVTDKWRITFQIPDFSSEGGGGGKSDAGGGSMKYRTVTIDAPSFYAGVNIINTSIPWRMNFEHVSAFVFSEEIAKSGDLGVIITPLVRFWEVRRSSNVIICKGQAQDFIAANQSFGGSVSKTLQDLVDESKDNGFFPQTSLGDLYDGIKSVYKQPIAIYGAVNAGDRFVKNGERYQGGYKLTGDYYAGEVPREGGNKIEFVGCVIANGDKEVGTLTGLETRLLLMLNGRFRRGIISIPDPEAANLVIPMDTRAKGKPVIKAEITDGKVYIKAKVTLEASIMAIQSRINYEEPQKLKVLEQHMAQLIKARMDKMIKKCQALNCDSIGFGRAVVQCFRWKTVDEWEQFNWLKQFSNSRIDTEIGVKIRHTGTLISDSPILSTGGSE